MLLPTWGIVKMTILLDVETNMMTMGTQAELVQMIVQKLYQNPSLIPVINNCIMAHMN